MRKQRKGRSLSRGFSLVELMIAMVVLVIGIMATMAMQFTSLAGYTAAREMTGATEMARLVEQRLRAEATQWAPGQPIPAGDSPYYENSLFSGATTSAWTLVTTTSPVSNRGLEVGARRFCVFIRGTILEDGDPSVAAPMDLVAATIAVVYPGANGSFPGRTGDNPWGDCGQIEVSDLVPQNPDRLEILGLRATYLSTTVSPRGN